jgi:hypothetical protein
MGVDNFVFRKEWYDVLKGCSAEVRQEVYEAVMIYAFEDVVLEMGAMAQMAFAFIRPQIDAMREKYEAKCEQLRANATKCKQTQPNASNKIKQNKIKQESVCDKSHDNAPAHPRTENFEKFKVWCSRVAPLALNFKEPLTVEEFASLYDTYGWRKMEKCAKEMHNKEASVKNRKALTTWEAFITKIS